MNMKNAENNIYHAKRNDGKSNNKNADTGTPSVKETLKTKNGDNVNNKERTNNDNSQQKQNFKNLAKEKAAGAVLSTVMPAPIAQGIAKKVVNKNSKNNSLINEEKKRILQNQDRLNMIRNSVRNAQDKKNDDTEEDESNNNLASSIHDSVQNIKKISGIVKFLKMIPPPILIVASSAIGLLFFFLILFSSIFSSNALAQTMNDMKNKIDESINTHSSSISSTNGSSSQLNPDQGTGKLGYPTDSRSISAGYPNYSSGAYHGGIDFLVSTGSNVYAAEAGEVIVKKQLNYSYGYYLYIKHDNGLCTLYAHNSELLVNEGDKVTKGQLIAKSGSTGNSTGPHCHFEVRTDCGVSGGSPSGTRVDPNNYLLE